MNKKQSQLTLDNVGLAYSFASTYKWHPRYSDIIQACLLGLCEAALRWDGRAAFSTYAHYWMHHCTNTELKEPDLVVDPASSEVFKSSDYEEIITGVLYIPHIREVLLRLVYELPEKERHTILLKYPLDAHSREYTDVDIAAMLECSTTWVGDLRKRAFCRLRERLVKEGIS